MPNNTSHSTTGSAADHGARRPHELELRGMFEPFQDTRGVRESSSGSTGREREVGGGGGREGRSLELTCDAHLGLTADGAKVVGGHAAVHAGII